VVVNNQVLDVTSFLDDHPGGTLAMLSSAGKDVTDEFNMINPEDCTIVPLGVAGCRRQC